MTKISKAVQAILFDLDGTLIRFPNLTEFFDELLVDTLAELKIKLPKIEERVAVWHSGGDFEKTIISWGVRDYNAFIELFDEKDLAKRRRLIEAGEIFAYPDVRVLVELKEYVKLGIVTNTPPKLALFELNKFNLKQYFDEIVMLGTIEQEIAKPEPDGFFRCLKSFQVSPMDAIMVGDSSSDIVGSHRAGMAAVFIQRPDAITLANLAEPPELTITDLRQLLELVK